MIEPWINVIDFLVRYLHNLGWTPVSHARLCFDELEEKYNEYMQNFYYDGEDKVVKVQQGLLEAKWMQIVMFIFHIVLKIPGMIIQLR